MGQGSSLSAARLGTTGFRERSSLSITTVRGVPIGGGALCGKDPHKVDKCGALRARQLAKKLVRGGVDEARVLLGWASGSDTPFLIEASTCQGGLNLQLPRDELPAEEWFTIKSIVRDLETACGWLICWGVFLPGLGSMGAMKAMSTKQ